MSKYLFKRRRYGWGWTPVTWQGWAIVGAALGIIAVTALLVPAENPDALDLAYYLGGVVLIIAALLAILFKTSPKPKWRWGKKDTDNPDEDF